MAKLIPIAIALGVVVVATSLCALAASAADSYPLDAKHVSQVWFCLERCGYNRTDTLAQLQAIRSHGRNAVTHISFERFDLGPNSTLIDNGFTNIVSDVLNASLVPIAMVTTVDLDRMRQLFANPDPFIDALLNATLRLGSHGVDFDFEPNANADEHDAAAYALFLSRISARFNAHRLSVGADAATWNAIWDFSLLGMSTANIIATMNTYVADYADFAAALNFSSTFLDKRQMVTGLLRPIPDAALEQMAVLMEKSEICRVALWDAPVPENFWPHLDGIAKRCRK